MFQQIIDSIKNFSATEWSLTITCFVELAVILFYNKGTMLCKDKLSAYEDELREVRKNLEIANNQITILKGGDLNED
ncbi:hypothetical protein [Eubacterium sp.]